MDCPPGSSVHGILQAKNTAVGSISFSRVGVGQCLPDPGIEPTSPALATGFFTAESPTLLSTFSLLFLVYITPLALEYYVVNIPPCIFQECD